MEQNFNNQSLISRMPPNDIEAEQAILSSMLYDREAIVVASEKLKGEHFYRPDNKIVYESMVEMFQANLAIDVVTLGNKLIEKGVLENIGGKKYIIDLADSYFTSANIKQYVNIVEEKATLRKLIKVSSEISAASFEGQESIQYILDMAEKNVFDIATSRDSKEFSHITEILATTIDRLEETANRKGRITGVATGFADFDARTAGLQASDLILIAARPSMGKTAFALNIAQNAAVRDKIPTAVFSLEMSKEQLVNRMLCAEAMIDSQKLRTGDLKDSDWTEIAHAMKPLSEAPLYIDDTPSISIGEMRAKCRKLKLEKGLGLIMIDYLQLMSGSGRESRQQEISEISRSLKALAREVGAPVIALSQLSRACDSRNDHRPILSDLRESGAIEQDADVVAFLYRDEYYNPETESKNMAEVIIAKQRNGPTGTVELAWLGSFTKFANLSKSEQTKSFENNEY